VLKLGGVSLALVAIEIAVAIAFMTLLGRAFGLRPKLTSLLAVGSAVCGVSAIIATQGAIDADEEDSSFAIAAILALGALSLFTFPLIGHALHLSDHAYGLWAGLAVDNTAEATAAGALYSDAAGKLAVLAKTTRNAMIGLCRPRVRDLLGQPGSSEGGGKQGCVPVAEISEVRSRFPADFCPGDLSLLHQGADHRAGKSFALGISSDLCRCWPAHEFSGMRKQGLRPFAVGAIGEVVIAVFTLVLVAGAGKLFGF